MSQFRRAKRQRRPRVILFRDLSTEKVARDPTERLSTAKPGINGGIHRQPCGGGYRVSRLAAKY